jgi:hypothetical protein
MMSRYFPDKDTAPLAEFVRGVLHITASVTDVSSQTANVVEIDFKADQAIIDFTPTFTSQPLSAEDLAGINLAIRNAIKTSVQPSNVTLPSGIAFAQMKTLSGPPRGVAILLNTQGGPGNPASMTSDFLTNFDHFAFGVSPDFLSNTFQSIVNNIVSQPPLSITIPIDLLFTTVHVVYDIKLNSGTLQLQDGKIVLTMQGHATQTSHKFYAPDNFDFTATFGFTLQADGSTANLIPLDVSLDTTSTIVNLFKGTATSGITQARDQALQQSGANDTVRNLLDVNNNLGGVFAALLGTSDSIFVKPGEQIALDYTSVEIRSTGIILHGSITAEYFSGLVIVGASAAITTDAPSVGSWPAPYVEFEQVPPSNRDPFAGILGEGANYSALKSWIPGGTIDEYEWNVQGQSLVDSNRFVYLPPPPVVTVGGFISAPVFAFAPVCLTVKGTRLSPAGLIIGEAVTASVCSYTTVQVLPGGLVAGIEGGLPVVALTQPGPEGEVVVTGHTPVLADTHGIGTPNLLVQFVDDKAAQNVRVLTDALAASDRPFFSTAIIAVLSSDQLAKSQHVSGVIYGVDQKGDWGRLFRIAAAARPVTLIIDPNGKLVWEAEGSLDRDTLAAALRKFLKRSVPIGFGVFESNVRIGRPAPNFLFEYAPSRQLPLRKLSGKQAKLVFWKASLRASIEAVLDAEKIAGSTASNNTVILAINDGDPADLARSVAAENKFTATVVTDPKREISTAYGVRLWPTILDIDTKGLVTSIQHGRDTGHHVGTP